MRGVGSTAFQLFDKVIVAVLAVVALFSVAAAIIRVRTHFDPKHIDSLTQKITDREAKSTHTETAVGKDYLTATVGKFRADQAGLLTRGYVFFRRAVKKEPDWRRPWMVEKSLADAQPKTYERTIPARYEKAEIKVLDEKIVTAKWSEGETPKLLVTPVAEGETKIQLYRQSRLQGEIPVTVKVTGRIRPEISPPKNFAVRAAEGQVEIVWGLPTVKHAAVKQIWLYRGEQEAKQDLLLTVILPAELKAGAELETRTPAGQVGPVVTYREDGFKFLDLNVEGEVTYWYDIEARGAGLEKPPQPVISSRAGAKTARIEEPFRLTFRGRSQDLVSIQVAVLHAVQAEQREWVAQTFLVARGQFVGHTVHRVSLGGGRVAENVAFGTGYQMLDILGNERQYTSAPVKNMKGEVIGTRQTEVVRQKVLLINRRGHIKVLGPEGL